MSTQKRNVLKNWFRKGLTPTQEQFADMLDSFFHKTDDTIPMDRVPGLGARLNLNKMEIQDYVDKVLADAQMKYHVRYVDITQLDDLFTPSDMFTMIAKGEYHLTGVWKVTHKSGNLDFTVGILEVFFDSMFHCLTQKLTTNAIINDDGTIDNAHEHKVRQYSRMYNLVWSNGTLPDGTSWPLKTWSAWKDLTDDVRAVADEANERSKANAQTIEENRLLIDETRVLGEQALEKAEANTELLNENITFSNETRVVADEAKASIPISGKLNLAKAETAAAMQQVCSSLSNGRMRFYLVTDQNGLLLASTVTAHSDVARLFGKDSLGASVGDICVIAKLNSLPVYRILPLNDAKAASGGFPGADGLETIWDKTQVNKIPGIETTANEARGMGASAYMPSLGEKNMDNALQPGVYPWCTLGRPNSSTGAYTCIVRKSYNADGGGYYTIEQTAYGRQGELGQVYKRIIFQKNDGSDTQYGEWILVSGGGPIIYEVHPEHFGPNTVVETTEEVYNKLYRIGTLQDRTTIPYIRVSWDEVLLYFTGRPNFSDLYVGADRLVWISYGIGFHILQLYKREDDDKPVFELTQKII